LLLVTSGLRACRGQNTGGVYNGALVGNKLDKLLVEFLNFTKINLFEFGVNSFEFGAKVGGA